VLLFRKRIDCDENGDAFSYWCFDFREPEWQHRISDVADHYVRQFDIDGYRVDAVVGSRVMNWRRAGFPPADRVPAHVPSDWWYRSLAEVGGEVPALPYTRGSLTLREGGLQMLQIIRATVKRNKPDLGAVLGEVQHPPYMQHADVVYDFDLMRLFLHVRSHSPSEFVRGLQCFLKEQKYAEPRNTVRLRYVESHDTVRGQGRYGVSAFRALTALTAWIDGMPMVYHDADVGHGSSMQKILGVRAALPELQEGDAFYEELKVEPSGVFACLRTLNDRVSIVIINMNPRACNAVVSIPVQQLPLDDCRRYAVWDIMTGDRLAEAAPSFLHRVQRQLCAWEATVLCLRPATALPPLQVESPRLPAKAASAEVAVTPPQIRESDGFIEVETSQYLLTLGRKSGLLHSLASGNGKVLLGECDFVLDTAMQEAEDVVADSKFAHDKQAHKCVLRFLVRLKCGGGLMLTYNCLPDHIEFEAILDDATPAERAGLVFTAPHTHRYEIKTAEGLLDDSFAPRHLSGKEPFSTDARPERTIYYRPQTVSVVWQSETVPLHPSDAYLRCVCKDGLGVEILVADPLRAGLDNVLLLDKFAGRIGWHAVFLWRDNTCYVPTAKLPAKFKLNIRPLPAKERPVATATVGGVTVDHTSLDWIVQNAHYRLLLRRTGGVVRTLWAKQPSLRPIAESNDLYTNLGFRRGSVNCASSANDVETGMRMWQDDGVLRMRFHGQLRDMHRFGIVRPPIRFAVEYAFDDSPTFRVRWSLLSEGNVREQSAFLAWTIRVPNGHRFVLLRDGQELTHGRLQSSTRTGETSKLPGKPAPDAAVFLDDEGRQLFRISGLNAKTPTDLSNVFVHGANLFLAWLDGHKNISVGQWHETQMSVTVSEIVSKKQPSVAWVTDELSPKVGVSDPSFEATGAEVFSANERRRVALGASAPSGWTVPRGGYITAETAHNGRRCAKLTNSTREDLFFTQPLPSHEYPPGCKLSVSAWVKGENIIPSEVPSTGGYIGLSFQSPNSEIQRELSGKVAGTFDWRKMECVATRPPDSTALMIQLGLNGATGTMWVDDVSVVRVD